MDYEKICCSQEKKDASPARIHSFLAERAADMKLNISNRSVFGISPISQSQPGSVIQRYSRFSPDQQKNNQSLGWKSPSMKALRVSNFRLLAAEEGTKGSNNRVWAIDGKIRASERVLKGYTRLVFR